MIYITHYKKLIGKKCYLSPVAVEDAEQWTEWLNDLDVALPLGSEAQSLLSRDKHAEYISSCIGSQDPIFAIVDLTSNQPIGRGILFNVNRVDRNCMVGLFIGNKELWGQGYGEDALSLLLDFGFNLLNLHNIWLGVYEFNQRAIACYRKLGFREVGRRRQVRIIGDKKFDVVLMDILAHEFTSPYVQCVLRKLT